jgi:hypothetical protein
MAMRMPMTVLRGFRKAEVVGNRKPIQSYFYLPTTEK